MMTTNPNITGTLDNDDYTLRRLFDGYVYHVPNYQRFYSWEEDHCEDLWADLMNITGEDNRHYMGTTILMAEDKPIATRGYEDSYREYAIVDGQQRFTTLVLLVDALTSAFRDFQRSGEVTEEISSFIQDQGLDELVEETESLFIEDESITDDRYGIDNKIRLQQDDNDIFKDILREEIVEDDLQKPSHQRLVNAKGFFVDQVEELRQNRDPYDFLNELGQLLSNVRALEFMVYEIETQGRATLIFESVNDRGKDLSKLDRTKSFLMHKLYLSETEGSSNVSMTDIQDRFGSIYQSMQTIEQKDRTSGVAEDQVQQYHYVANIPTNVNKAYLYNETDRDRTLKGGAPVYLQALKWHFDGLYHGRDLEIYSEYPRDCVSEIDWYTSGLRSFYGNLAHIAGYDDDDAVEWEVRKLFALGRTGNFYPLILAVWERWRDGAFSDEELHRILQTIEVASFRIYTVANKRSDTGRSRLYSLANDVMGEEMGVDGILSKLESLVGKYESDFEETLRTNNAYHQFAKSDLRYLLYSYDLYIREESKGGAQPDMEKAVQNAGRDYSIDHVWARDSSKLGLDESEEEVHDEIKHSLGNLTLTTGRRNSKWRNDPYAKKRTNERYMDSDFAATRLLARENETWGPESIENRLHDLVEYATTRWSLNPGERGDLAAIRPP